MINRNDGDGEATDAASDQKCDPKPCPQIERSQNKSTMETIIHVLETISVVCWILGCVFSLVVHHRDLALWTYCAALVLTFVAGFAWYQNSLWKEDERVNIKKPPEVIAEKIAPEVALRFEYKESPAVVIENKSDTVARDIKWAVILWNADLPDRKDPLPIPVNKFDWIKPKGQSGRQAIFLDSNVTSLIKKGDRLIGSAFVDCPESKGGRTYAVFIQYGEGGWYAHVKWSGELILPKRFDREYREAIFKLIDSLASKELRVPIVDP